MRTYRTEAELTKDLTASIESSAGLVFPIVGGSLQQPGWPDRWFAVKGLSGFYETKGPKGRLSELQGARIRRILDLRAFAVVIAACEDGTWSCIPGSRSEERTPGWMRAHGRLAEWEDGEKAASFLRRSAEALRTKFGPD